MPRANGSGLLLAGNPTPTNCVKPWLLYCYLTLQNEYGVYALYRGLALHGSYTYL